VNRPGAFPQGLNVKFRDVDSSNRHIQSSYSEVSSRGDIAMLPRETVRRKETR